MKRPVAVNVAIVIQFALALLLGATAVYILLLTRSQDTLSDPDPDGTIQGLIIGAIVLAIPALFSFLGAYGMWKGKFWGWWLALLTALVVDATLIYNVFEDGWREAERKDIFLAVCFAGFAVVLLLPRVYKFYWSKPKPQPDSSGTELGHEDQA